MRFAFLVGLTSASTHQSVWPINTASRGAGHPGSHLEDMALDIWLAWRSRRGQDLALLEPPQLASSRHARPSL